MLSTNVIIKKAKSYENVLSAFLISSDGFIIDFYTENQEIDKDYLSSIYLKIYDDIKKTSIRIGKEYPKSFIIETDSYIIGFTKLFIDNDTLILVIEFNNKIDTSKIDVFLNDIKNYFS
ncbi:MAG: hypothetical protein KatS3mg068_1960 [Candidatus Sericytochromatia bacterium]|nr:MAG: hypothetical protein KatS3mg068_1960 [Candidatus Sericytochromatia bacterium]